MIPSVDLTPIIVLAVFGAICAVIAVVGGGLWLGWHLFMALRLYLGGV